MPAVITQPEYGILPVVGALPAIPLNTPAWDVESYAEWLIFLELVGEDRIIPGNPGRLALPDEIDEAIVGLPFVIYGEQDLEGTPYADARVGLRTNLRYLRTNLFRPPGTADGTRPFEFHDLDGVTVETADVKLRTGTWGFPGSGSVVARTTLRLIIPAGEPA